ncbi:PhoX family phosphatase [Polaromonas sp.]|uniref:PhoX family protein n=1 Tax=Polaromonas sp. TaxID=1869339 RepID=UPI001847A5DB|nr:PhoX family phosphatase [Polaromonas sp.]NMM07892.1 PhoX family phosphatase [Polaromonas sp.]
MNAITRSEQLTLQSHDEENCNTSANASLNDVIEARMSRRSVFKAGLGSAGAAVLGSFGLAACGGGNDGNTGAAPPPAPAASLDFKAVAKNRLDAVTIAEGYTAKPLYALGDPLSAATPAYKNDGSDTDFDNRAGDHHDGMQYFGLNAAGTGRDADSSERGLLVMNHEATSNSGGEIASTFLHVDGGTNTLPRPAAEVDKEIPIHGVSVVEVRKINGQFAYQKNSAFNRRITPLTPMQLNGVARGHALMKTSFSAAGTDCRGTLNNCGTGLTPWGTYLSGEENWAGYFTRSATDNTARGGAFANSVVALNRYGRAQGAASRHGWQSAGTADQYARWNVSQRGASPDGSDDYRNELNTFGYMVEIDPYDKNTLIRKRTSLGRFAHESGIFGKAVAGKPLAVYMGDDSQGEYIYKFVSTTHWAAADASPANRITTGDKYLDSGKLYVAKFNADGSGQWIELSMANAAVAAYAPYKFADNGDVAVNLRLAADAVGATRMDRPEWSAVHPVSGEIYYTLTNNASRKVEPTGTETAVDAANPRSYTDAPTAPTAPRNVNGHILRMREAGDEPAATGFAWDVYLFGAQADADPVRVNLSSLTDDQDFSSPDGVWFSPKTGLCFIQTDDGAYTDVTNCMMLIGKPGKVGDGSTPTLSYTKADGSTLTVQTRLGAKPTAATLKRFLVGPVDCEITGCTETPDGKTLFINIQHPGETIRKANLADPTKYLSHWPGNAGYGAGGALARPRSATIVITRNDGGLIGS